MATSYMLKLSYETVNKFGAEWGWRARTAVDLLQCNCSFCAVHSWVQMHCSKVQRTQTLKGTRGEEANWPDDVKSVQIFPSVGFVGLFFDC